MSQTLSELLSAIEPIFTFTLRELEQSSGYPNIDIRLSAEIIGKAHLKKRELGLDPQDTTDRELYHALLYLAQRHDEFIVRAIGGKDPNNVEDILPRIIKKFNDLPISKDVWALKPMVARKLLKKMPPKKVMKQLGYKSIDSMLKRENVAELFCGLRIAESPAWLNKFVHTYKNLTSTDFENRPLEVVQLSKKRWGSVAESFVMQQRHNITHLKEIGVIGLLPLTLDEMPGIALIALLMLLHYANELRLYSTFFKFHQLKPNFGDIVIHTLISDPNNAGTIAGQHLHWRVIQRFYGKGEKAARSEIFEPHIQPEDLIWSQADQILYRVEPALKFWQDMDYVGVMANDRRPISFNIMDMAINYCNGLEFANRSSSHMRDSLWNEIFIRYLGEEKLEKQILEQLETDANITIQTKHKIAVKEKA